MSKYDIMTVVEILRLHECCGMTVEINDGHITAINWEV